MIGHPFCPQCGAADLACGHTGAGVEWCWYCGAHEREHPHDCGDVGGMMLGGGYQHGPWPESEET